MIKKTLALKDNQILVGTVIVSLGSFIGSFFSYLLQVYLGRTLSVSDYGTFNALLSLMIILGIPTTAVTTSLIKYVAKLEVQNRFDILTHLFNKLSAYALLFGILLFCMVVSFSKVIGNYLNITDMYAIYAFGISLGVSLLSITPYSYLQGLLRFKAFAFSTVVGSFLRLILPIMLLTFVSIGISGVFLGMAMAVILGFVVSLFLLKKNFTSYNKQTIDVKTQVKMIVKFSITTTLVTVGLNLLNNVDVLLVKHYFDADTAGIYSSIVTVGKVFLFGASTVTLVMYPQISQLYAANKEYLARFKQFVTFQIILVALGIICFYMFSPLIISVLFGDKFISAAEYLPKFAVFVGLYILIYFMTMYFLAINKTKVFVLLLLGVIAQFILLSAFHDSVNSVINVNILVSMLLFLSTLLYYFKDVSVNNSSNI